MENCNATQISTTIEDSLAWFEGITVSSNEICMNEISNILMMNRIYYNKKTKLQKQFISCGSLPTTQTSSSVQPTDESASPPATSDIKLSSKMERVLLSFCYCMSHKYFKTKWANCVLDPQHCRSDKVIHIVFWITWRCDKKPPSLV